MKETLNYPFDSKDLLQKRKSFKRSLREDLKKTASPKKVKIAIAGGNTTNLITEILELHLLREGYDCEFYQTDYNRYYEEIVFDTGKIWDFSPDIVYLHTSVRNIENLPVVGESEAHVQEKLQLEFARWKKIWETVQAKSKAIIIQNNFELPMERPLGNLAASDTVGNVHFVQELNRLFADFVSKVSGLYLNDLQYLSSFYGLRNWFDQSQWFHYKYAYQMNATNLVAGSVAGIIKSVHGKSKKCLILDLDNTLWGGIIGDDGVGGIKLGKDDPIGEAYIDFQGYIKKLKDRGIILAVCSKNDPQIARQGFTHPDSVLSVDDFVSFEASWGHKPDAIAKIAKELNIGLSSVVFIDDNPAERKLVKEALPEVEVPDLGDNVLEYIHHLDKNGYFETLKLVEEDLKKHQSYKDNLGRTQLSEKFANYEDYLKSLEMTAEMHPFSQAYLERITQLINKTNQFNLTNLRMDVNDVQALIGNPNYITLSVRLKDSFGDNGIVSLLIGQISGSELNLDLWVMSCRVFKRDLEYAIFDELVRLAKDQKIKTIRGRYHPSEKNGIVKDLYHDLGFQAAGDAVWIYKIENFPGNRNKVMKVNR